MANVTAFCTGKLIDGRLTYWMPLDPEDIIHTPDVDEAADAELRRLEEKQDEIDSAQGEYSDPWWA
jgi:hypothetical protein